MKKLTGILVIASIVVGLFFLFGGRSSRDPKSGSLLFKVSHRDDGEDSKESKLRKASDSNRFERWALWAQGLSDDALKNAINEHWAQLSSETQRTVFEKLAMLFRELGKREQAAALDWVDQLKSFEHRRDWIQARMSVLGGWGMVDPANAGKAALKESRVLWQFQLSTDFELKEVQKRVIRDDFQRWVEVDPIAARKELDQEIWSSHLNQFLGAYEGVLSAMSFSDLRDAVLSDSGLRLKDPDDSWDVIRSKYLIYARALGEATPEILDKLEGTFGSVHPWGLYEPVLARRMLVQRDNLSSGMRYKLLEGIAYSDPDYLGLLEAFPDDEYDSVAFHLAEIASSSRGENVWPVDGKEGPWKLTRKERLEAIEEMIARGNFSDEYRENLRVVSRL